MDGLSDTCATFVSLPPNSTPHTKGVRYLVLSNLFTEIRGAMNDLALGSKRRKHIIIRPSRFRKGLHELYTYHFPTHWSAACVANRELIKEAQRQAHALEHDYSFEGLEWRLRFFKHYFNVFRRNEDPAPGLKRYSRFYQYTYVCIYRALQEAAKAAQEESALAALAAQQKASSVLPDNIRLASSLGAPNDSSEYSAQLSTPRGYSREFPSEDVTFEPIEPIDPHTILSRPVKIRSSIPINRLFDQKSVPKFAHVRNFSYLCTEIEYSPLKHSRLWK